ncbi:hypothetical protein EDB86DRAFT_2833423 [Lactarius hatsudake]|nr:hypothetical protein EDB86DRAFT_2833423 [Lactarius hatsudake]
MARVVVLRRWRGMWSQGSSGIDGEGSGLAAMACGGVARGVRAAAALMARAVVLWRWRGTWSRGGTALMARAVVLRRWCGAWSRGCGVGGSEAGVYEPRGDDPRASEGGRRRNGMERSEVNKKRGELEARLAKGCGAPKAKAQSTLITLAELCGGLTKVLAKARRGEVAGQD